MRCRRAARPFRADEDWRTVDTEHFRVTFPERLDVLGQRTAVIAEDALDRLESAFMEAPQTRIEIVLTDHLDASNGLASVSPYPRVVVYARPPVDGRALSHHDDWLDLVVVHELAHILHLDRAGGPGAILRRLFGRVPATWPFFPGSATPRWVIEGLATWYESALTDAGRVEGSVFDMYIRTAALENRLEQIDQASGQTARWPAGERPYAWGSFFFEWLMERHGPERMADFVEAVAGQWIPYRLNSASRHAFGESFSDAWAEWSDSVTASALAEAEHIRGRSSLPAIEVLTDDARLLRQPQVSPDGRALAVARADGRSDSGLRITPVDAPESGGDRWIRTNGISDFEWLPSGALLVSQAETEGPWRVRTDLFEITPDGRSRRLTRGARLDHPAAGPDGTWGAAIRTGAGTTDLVRVQVSDGSLEVVAPGADSVYWSHPSVSPERPLDRRLSVDSRSAVSGRVGRDRVGCGAGGAR